MKIHRRLLWDGVYSVVSHILSSQGVYACVDTSSEQQVIHCGA
jgi:hypothetical protein